MINRLSSRSGSSNRFRGKKKPQSLLVGKCVVTNGLQLFLDAGDNDSYPTTGTNVINLAGGVNSVLINGVGFSSSNNGVFTFDGLNDYIDTNRSFASESFTLSAWIKCNDVSGYRMIFSKEQTGGWPWNYRLFLNQTNGHLVADIAQSASQYQTITYSTNLADNNWHNVVFIRSVTDDKLYLYVDGSLVSTLTDAFVGSVQNSQEVWIGRSAYTAGYNYKGSISNVLIYNRDLSSSEVSQNYSCHLSRFITPTPTPTTTPTPTVTETPTITNTPTVTPTPTLTFTSTPTTTISQPVAADPTLEIWYDFSDSATISLGSGTDITSVNDKSTGTVKPANSTGGKRPKQTVAYQNNLNVAYFDGDNDLFTVNPITNFQSISGNTMIVVGKFNNPSATNTMTQLGTTNSERNGLWLSINGGKYKIGMGQGLATTNYETVDTNFHIYTCVFDGTQTGDNNRVKFRIDGVERSLTFTQSVSATTSSDTSVFYIGETASATEDLDGYVGEVLLYTKTLNSTELLNTENYLKNKWGITTPIATPTPTATPTTTSSCVPVSGTPRVLFLGDSNVSTVASNVSSYCTATGNSISYSAVTMSTTYAGAGLTNANYDVVVIYTNSSQTGAAGLSTALTNFVNGGGHVVSGVFIWNLYASGFPHSGVTPFNVTNAQSNNSTGNFTVSTTSPITNGIGTSFGGFSFTNTNPSLSSDATLYASYSSDGTKLLAVKNSGCSKLIGINTWFASINSSTSTLCKMVGNSILYASGKI